MAITTRINYNHGFAIKRPGALTRKSHAAGESINKFARENLHTKGLTGKQSRFYYNILRKANKNR